MKDGTDESIVNFRSLNIRKLLNNNNGVKNDNKTELVGGSGVNFSRWYVDSENEDNQVTADTLRYLSPSSTGSTRSAFSTKDLHR